MKRRLRVIVSVTYKFGRNVVLNIYVNDFFFVFILNTRFILVHTIYLYVTLNIMQYSHSCISYFQRIVDTILIII